MRMNTLDDITTLIKNAAHSQGATIPKESLIEWMKSEDINILGAVSFILLNDKLYALIEPKLRIQEYQPFLLKYWIRCLVEDPQGEWCESRDTAAHSFSHWFKRLWTDPQVPRTIFIDMKLSLEKLFMQKEKAVRDTITSSILEPLFQDHSIQELFANWKTDEGLRAAYIIADEWAKAHKTAN